MNKFKFPMFRAGDVSGLTYAIAGNVINYIIVIATLKYVLSWPDALIFGKVIPGMSIGLMLSGIYYSYMAYKLAKKENRTDVTALPSGVSTPAMFVYLYGIVMPLNYALGDPELVWRAAVAATFLGGAIEACGSFLGPALRKLLPRAALLGTVAGIALVWMANKGMFDVYADPVLGLPILIIAVVGLIGGYVFPKKIPALLVSVVGGVIYAALLGRVQPDFSTFAFNLPNPIAGLGNIFQGFGYIVPFLSVIIPIEIYNFIETMDNVEGAIAAGDHYNVREAQIADGACTMISAMFGGIIPNTVWLGHAGLKKSEAGIGYSWIAGIVLGLCGIIGAFGLINSIIPPAITAMTFLWCSLIIVSQAYKESIPFKHTAAVTMAIIPHIADYAYTEITGALGAVGFFEVTPEISQALIDNGVMWSGVAELKYGAILTGMLWAGATAFIIDKRLDKAAWVFIAAAVLSGLGFIHSPQLVIDFSTWTVDLSGVSKFFFAYLITAVACFIFHYVKGLVTAPKDFDYV